MFATPIRRLAQASKKPVVQVVKAQAAREQAVAQVVEEPVAASTAVAVRENPYQARKMWPPRFDELSPQQQLYYEKKWKRRLLIANRRPSWDKKVKFVQLFTVVTWLVFGFFFCDAEIELWGEEYRPSMETRKWVNQLFGILDREKLFVDAEYIFPDGKPPK